MWLLKRHHESPCRVASDPPIGFRWPCPERTRREKLSTQDTDTVNSPGRQLESRVPHTHQGARVTSVGKLARVTVGALGVPGGVVTGIQGMGVSTLIAAAVAAATDRFAGDMHTPSGIIFTRGTSSMIFASGWFSVFTRFTKSLDIIPIVHCNVAPLPTCCGM